MSVSDTPQEAPNEADLPSPARAVAGARIIAKLNRNPMINRIENPHLEVYWRSGFASPDECARMREMIDAGAVPSELFSGSEGPDYRTSNSCHLDPEDPLVASLTDRIVAMMGIDPSHGETIQGQRYQPGQEYRHHCDWFNGSAPFWPRMRETGGQRCWTAMIYLNSLAEGEGGETLFPQLGFEVTPHEGTILIWNNLDAEGAPSPYSLHAAKPVLSGAKYVLTKWFRERPWRYAE